MTTRPSCVNLSGTDTCSDLFSHWRQGAAECSKNTSCSSFISLPCRYWLPGRATCHGYERLRDRWQIPGLLGGGVLSPATGESAWLLLGLTGMGAMIGFSAYWVVVGELLGVAIMWFLTVSASKPADYHDAITVIDYLVGRFRSNTHVLRVIPPSP